MRNLLLKVHLYLGLAAAIFLIILGVTGAIIAFEAEIDRATHSSLWYVKTGPHMVPEEDLVRTVQEKFAPARVAAIQYFRQPDLVQVMQMTDRASVYVNPYDGTIQGRTTGRNETQQVLAMIHQIHLRLAPDPRNWPTLSTVGKQIINWAGAILVILVPTGVILWWRTRRASIKFSGSWFRICFDAHHMIGIYAALFLFVAAFTGVMIGFDFGEESVYKVTHSEPPQREKPMQSTPAPGAKPIGADRAVEIARGAMPEASVTVVQMPMNPKAAYNVLMRVPEETSEAVHSSVALDQFSGQVLKVKNFKTDSQGYRIIRFNRSIHTGDVLGTPTHILMSLSSLLLVAMALTGVVIWWKKLAV